MATKYQLSENETLLKGHEVKAFDLEPDAVLLEVCGEECFQTTRAFELLKTLFSIDIISGYECVILFHKFLRRSYSIFDKNNEIKNVEIFLEHGSTTSKH